MDMFGDFMDIFGGSMVVLNLMWTIFCKTEVAEVHFLKAGFMYYDILGFWQMANKNSMVNLRECKLKRGATSEPVRNGYCYGACMQIS